ncbi:MAG: DUF5606 domain-containing protein [Bacteroidetes bacterium]|nr:DUF5606 domain-containing protein [Bacteroidota bacterium]MBL0096305.1 DUF5606 domain-containing protein [Bacteroidota bacterium]
MSFDKIISVPGLSGLFKMVAQMRNSGFVVESLADGRRIPVSSMQRIIMLKDIAVYTMEDDIPLYDVFKKMKEQDALALSISPKAEPADLKATLKKILPEFDDERVHASDIRKMFIWYKLVKDIVGSPEAEEAMKLESGEMPVKEPDAEEPAAEVVAEKVVKKKAVKKKEEVVAEATTDEAPKKKARKSSKTAE